MQHVPASSPHTARARPRGPCAARENNLPGALLLLALAASSAAASGCTAVAHGAPLSSRPAAANQILLTTGAAPAPYRTLGFVQATGFGNQVAGVVDIGDAQIDSTIKGALVNAALRMGGDGVINIEFLDENPQTPAERAGDLADSLSPDENGRREVKTRWRSVRALGEVIQFIR